MKKTRLYYSLMNSSISTIVFLLRLIMQFIVRTYFIKFLGITYLGMNGLFSNVLSLLSLAELGIGTSIVYSMYEPIAKKEYGEVSALMRIYKKAYHYVGLIVAIIGLALVPFLKYFSSELVTEEGFLLYYFLFLANSVVSYFFTYKRSLLIANQKNYLVNLNDFVFLFIGNCLQVFFLFMYKNFAIYLVLQLIFTLLGNISISMRVDKEYAFLKHVKINTLSREKVSVIKKNVVGNMSSKIGGVIVMGTDSILISSFIGLAAVGFYSNYTMIVNNVQNLCKQVTNSITASIGNYVVDANKKQAILLFKRHLFVNYSLIYFAILILVSVLNPFIQWWLGIEYLLPKFTVALILINLTVQMFRNTNFVFIDSFGLYWIQRWKSIIEASINLTVSLILLNYFNMGINGVLLGTIVSSLGYVMWVEIYYIFKYGLKMSMMIYIHIFLKYILFLSFSIIPVIYVQTFISYNGLVSVVVKTFSACICGGLLYILAFHKDTEFRYIVDILKRLVKRMVL